MPKRSKSSFSPQEVQEIVQLFDAEFPETPTPLTHRNAFELLLAVILSAQCTDERVNQVTPHLFPEHEACTPEHILELGEAEVKRIIHPCGYYNSKTKAVMGTAQALLGKDVPSSLEALTALPGVGNKTAQVIQSQWFKMDAFPVDTHIHRVCNRLGLADSGKNRDKTERQVKAAVPKEHWSKLHLQIIFHGRKTCSAYKPKCGSCALKHICRWEDKIL